MITVKACAAVLAAVMLLAGTNECKASGTGRSSPQTFPYLNCGARDHRIKVTAFGKGFDKEAQIEVTFSLSLVGTMWRKEGRAGTVADGRGAWSIKNLYFRGPLRKGMIEMLMSVAQDGREVDWVNRREECP